MEPQWTLKLTDGPVRVSAAEAAAAKQLLNVENVTAIELGDGRKRTVAGAHIISVEPPADAAQPSVLSR